MRDCSVKPAVVFLKYKNFSCGLAAESPTQFRRIDGIGACPKVLFYINNVSINLNIDLKDFEKFHLKDKPVKTFNRQKLRVN